MRSGVRIALAQLISLPIGCCVALGLLYVSTSSSHRQPTPFEIVGELAEEAAEGDEELLIFLGFSFLSVTVAYLVSGFRLRGASPGSLVSLLALSLATAFCAGLERLWRPHIVAGNVATAVACLAAFVVVYVRALNRLARAADSPAA